ncbi:MAG: hypothetical protein HRU32_13610, partial [Rhodobacteraceae bacterium]|nr:hypothetical protein [Paracoccaceae bacterium]
MSGDVKKSIKPLARTRDMLAPTSVFVGLFMCSLLVLTACSPSPQPRTLPLDQRFSFSNDPSEMRRQLAGRTAKFDGPAHGTQIEFFHPNGKAYLWYPGNTSAVPSEWRIEAGIAAKSDARICFRYPNQSYNPVTRQFGGKWECSVSAVFRQDMTALIEGDEFDLGTGRIPNVMPSGAILSTSEIENLIGRSIEGEFLFG